MNTQTVQAKTQLNCTTFWHRNDTNCRVTTAGPVTLINVYAPTLSATPDAKDEFYDRIAATISNIPSKEEVVLLGDFNARVGSDHDSWPSCLGQFGVGKMSDNGHTGRQGRVLRQDCSHHQQHPKQRRSCSPRQL